MHTWARNLFPFDLLFSQHIRAVHVYTCALEFSFIHVSFQTQIGSLLIRPESERAVHADEKERSLCSLTFRPRKSPFFPPRPL
jgi:hypothetical protein